MTMPYNQIRVKEKSIIELIIEYDQYASVNPYKEIYILKNKKRITVRDYLYKALVSKECKMTDLEVYDFINFIYTLDLKTGMPRFLYDFIEKKRSQFLKHIVTVDDLSDCNLLVIRTYVFGISPYDISKINKYEVKALIYCLNKLSDKNLLFCFNEIINLFYKMVGCSSFNHIELENEMLNCLIKIESSFSLTRKMLIYDEFIRFGSNQDRLGFGATFKSKGTWYFPNYNKKLYVQYIAKSAIFDDLPVNKLDNSLFNKLAGIKRSCRQSYLLFPFSEIINEYLKTNELNNFILKELAESENGNFDLNYIFQFMVNNYFLIQDSLSIDEFCINFLGFKGSEIKKLVYKNLFKIDHRGSKLHKKINLFFLGYLIFVGKIFKGNSGLIYKNLVLFNKRKKVLGVDDFRLDDLINVKDHHEVNYCLLSQSNWELLVSKWTDSELFNIQEFIDLMYMINEDSDSNMIIEIKRLLANHRKSRGVSKIHDGLCSLIEKKDIAGFELKQDSGYFKKVIPKLMKFKEYDIKIPKTNHELMDWGNILGNCIGSDHYAKDSLKGRILLIGLFKNGVLKYTVEIDQKGEILQCEGQSRCCLNQINLFRKVVKDCFINI
jgi:hypothetical protein